MKCGRLWLGALVAVVAAAVRPVEGAPPMPATVQVCFVPPDDCSALIIGAISGARTGIRVAAYELTSAPIEAALIGAHQRGVDVEALLDRANLRPMANRPGSAAVLASAGVPVWIDRPNGIAHNKFMIVDDDLVIGGSFNYTAAAQARNAENLTMTRSAEIAAEYVGYWNARKSVSMRYAPE